MPTLHLQGTKFTFNIQPLPLLSDGKTLKIELGIENEYIHYHTIVKNIVSQEIDQLITAMHRMLAGAYTKEYNLPFDIWGFAFDLYPNPNMIENISRQALRQSDCVVAFRLLMRGEDRRFLGGVFTLLLHKKDVEFFANKLREEYNSCLARFGHGRGKFRFVGVSPFGYSGCNYWYFDSTHGLNPGDYAWVCMGRHNTEQIVYVDSVKLCSLDTLPCPEHKVKDVIRAATPEEVAARTENKDE